jgi:hypothetical protein
MENLTYIKGVLERFERLIDNVNNAKSSFDISEAERELGPIMKDLQLAVPRLGNDVAKLVRERRAELR